MEIPDHLLQGLPKALRAEVSAWWEALPDTAKNDLSRQWDHRADECRFTLYYKEEDSQWCRLPFDAVAEEDDIDDWEEKREFFEYAVNHEFMVQDEMGRTSHVCRAHSAACTATRNGRIPADFVCPVSDTSCPMRAIVALAGGRSVRLLGSAIKT